MSKKAPDMIYRWVEAPKPTLPMPNASVVLGVHPELGEEVEWLWTHTAKGSYINGYNIIKKEDLNMRKRARK